MLFNITTKYQYHLIACHPAKKKLKDGRNAHLIVETPDWWKNKLSKYNWKIVFEKVKEKEKFIQGQQIHMVKYIVLLEKNE
jgi:predicted transcriptional regulator